MTVGELKKMLERYPDDMEILNTRYSDYDLVVHEDWSVIRAVPSLHGTDWYTRYHETMKEEDKARAKDYLHLVGN